MERIQGVPKILAMLLLLRGNEDDSQPIAERKQRDRQARRAQIIRTARRIAELEGWSSVTVRRLADEISYSQPVLYAHFENREGILAAVAIEGFQEIGLALEKARKKARNGKNGRIGCGRLPGFRRVFISTV